VIEVREVLRAWLAGAGLRTVAAQAGVDRKTARRYVEAAEAAGVVRAGGYGQKWRDAGWRRAGIPALRSGRIGPRMPPPLSLAPG
jgi:hypothetical protein